MYRDFVICFEIYLWHCSSFHLHFAANIVKIKSLPKDENDVFQSKIQCRFQFRSKKYKILNLKFFPIDLYRARSVENEAKMGKNLCKKNKSSNMGHIEPNNSNLVKRRVLAITSVNLNPVVLLVWSGLIFLRQHVFLPRPQKCKR